MYDSWSFDGKVSLKPIHLLHIPTLFKDFKHDDMIIGIADHYVVFLDGSQVFNDVFVCWDAVQWLALDGFMVYFLLSITMICTISLGMPVLPPPPPAKYMY